MNERFSPIKQKRVSEEIVEQLKSLIFDEKLKPGERLPPERELAKSLNVSRVSLREALNTLQGMGLVETQQGNRSFVRPIASRSLSDPLLSYCKKSSSNILKVFEVRKHLEIVSVSLAVERSTNDDIKKLEKIIKVMEEDLEKNRLGAKADFDFHTTIAESTHNLVFTHTINVFYDLLSESFRFAWANIFEDKSEREKSFKQHQNIFKSIAAKDPQRGTEAILIHMNYIERIWKKALL